MRYARLNDYDLKLIFFSLLNIIQDANPRNLIALRTFELGISVYLNVLFKRFRAIRVIIRRCCVRLAAIEFSRNSCY